MCYPGEIAYGNIRFLAPVATTPGYLYLLKEDTSQPD